MEKLAFSIKEFCFQHGISRSKFYDLVRNGLAPKMMKLGSRRVISVEAAKEWRHEYSIIISCGGEK
jgi:predicted DNA-binding transcriptional regulator AlpA